MRHTLQLAVISGTIMLTSCVKNMEPFEGSYVHPKDPTLFVRFYPGDYAITNANDARRPELYRLERTDGDIWFDPVVRKQGELRNFEITKNPDGIGLQDKWSDPLVTLRFVPEVEAEPNKAVHPAPVNAPRTLLELSEY